MESTLQAICNDPLRDDVDHLIALVAEIRPRDPEDTATACTNLRALTLMLEKNAAFAAALREQLLHLLATKKHVHLYTDTGILSNEGYFSALFRRISQRILPEAVNRDYLKDLFGLVFHQRRDHVWVSGLADQLWFDLFDALDLEQVKDAAGHVRAYTELLDALQILSYRVAAIGLEPELVRNFPDIEDFDSPFLAQNEEVRDFCKARINLMSGIKIPEGSAEAALLDDRHIIVLLEQCAAIVGKIRKQAASTGASISLTYHLERVTGMLRRMHTLLQIIADGDAAAQRDARLGMFRELVREENHKHSVRVLTRRVTDLIALRVTDNASRTGEHYVTTDRAEYFTMLRSALGAGFIVGFMAAIKIVFGKLKLPLFGEAFLNSMNYSFGFILVHVCHFTIATKQPAMTASTIAATVDEVSGTRVKAAELDRLANLIAATLRTQLVAIFGNVALAMPIAFVIAWAVFYAQGAHFVSPEKAAHMLADIDPFSSLALFYAAIAGVCLFLAGLISGYYDNKALYGHLGNRLKQLRWLNTLIGAPRAARFADYMDHNSGAIAGNFFFGIMLGSVGTLGIFFGLPIDVRHVTFSSANVAYALVALDYQLPWQTIATSLAGVALIGMVNLGVSFTLALLVAMKARQVRFGESARLISTLWRRFCAHPREFFLPPSKADDAAAAAATQAAKPSVPPTPPPPTAT